MRDRSGFTLIELMIVISVIAILAVVSVHLYQRVRVGVNESNAIKALRTVSTAQTSVHKDEGTYAALAFLGSKNPSYIDSVLASGTKHGYVFKTSAVTEHAYQCTAEPQYPDKSGIRSFYIDDTGVLREGLSSTGTPLD